MQSVALLAMEAALKTAGAVPKVLSVHLGQLKAAGGDAVQVDDLIVTMPSVVFDAVYAPRGSAGIAALKASPDAVYFVREAYKHLKPIGAQGEGADLLSAAGVLRTGATSPGVTISGSEPAASFANQFMADIAVHRHWNRDKDMAA